MFGSRLTYLFSAVLLSALAFMPFAASAATVNINAPQWLGNLKLDKTQLSNIKKAVKEALEAPIDQEIQCAEVRGDCVVRAAREWTYQGDRFREIVVYLHTKGHASKTIAQAKGRWPTIITGLEKQKKKKKARKKSKKKKAKK
ncbi:MAG: hypothetical protein ACE5ET_05020 [Gammaproteobacteria bacterium]